MNRKLIPILLILCSISSVYSQSSDSLVQKAYAAYQQKRFVESAVIIERAITAGVSDPVVYYNAACFFALSGRKEKAWYYLEKSIHTGYQDVAHMQKDSDLVTLWTDIKWKTVIEQMRMMKPTIENRNAIIADMNNIAAHAYQYMIRPSSMGGGGGSYAGYRIPIAMASNQNGNYSVTAVAGQELMMTGTYPTGGGTVTAIVNSRGQAGRWQFSGAFLAE
jgi:hypothetical protein